MPLFLDEQEDLLTRSKKVLARALLASVVFTNIITEPVMAQSLQEPEFPAISSSSAEPSSETAEHEPGSMAAEEEASEEAANLPADETSEETEVETEATEEASENVEESEPAEQLPTEDTPLVEPEEEPAQVESDEEETVDVPTETQETEEVVAPQEVQEHEIEASLISVGSVEQPVQTHPAFTVNKSPEVQSVQELTERLRITMVHPNGTSVSPSFEVTESQGEYTVTLLPGSNFVPGNYGITAVIDGTRGASRKLQSLFRATEGDVEDIVVLDSTVQWGTVLANTDRLTYKPGDTVYVSVSALSDSGNPICDATITLEHTAPDGLHKGSLTMQSPQECTTETLPVFTAALPLSALGQHTLTVIADTADGSRTASLQVQVQDESSIISLRRIGSSAVSAGQEGEMTIVLRPSHTFVGTVSEQIPSGIEILSSTPKAEQIGSSLEWKKQWNAGQEYELTYTYRISSDGSQVWLLGPLEANGIVEPSAISVPQEPEEVVSSSSSSTASSSSSSSTVEEIISESSSSSTVEITSESSSSSSVEEIISESSSSSSFETSTENEAENLPEEDTDTQLPTEETEPATEEEDGPLSGLLNDIFNFFVPQAVAQETVDRELRFRELRLWQILSAVTVVGEVANANEETPKFQFVESDPPQEETQESEMALDLTEGTNAVAMGEDPKSCFRRRRNSAG